MVFYNVFVAFVGLNNNTIVYAQYQIRIGLVDTPIRQKMPVLEWYRYWISDQHTPNYKQIIFNF